MSDNLKSAFLANMSHEIRTPLNAIVGFSHLIAESDDAEERKTYYQIVEANNERLLQLINEILDLSKIESGTIEFSLGLTSLHSLCQEIHDAHIFRTPEGVQLVYEPSDESLRIETDKNRVFQVISNLIGNAVKFTKEGSIKYGYELVDGQIVFHVTDTGTGIEPEKVGRVFERFAKLNKHAQGTGLGLSICKSIVERLGGQISVSSIVGVGTTFTFTLPYNTQETPKEVDSEMKTVLYKEEVPQSGNGGSTNEGTGKGTGTGTGTETGTGTGTVCILIAEDTDSNYDLLNAILSKQYRLVRANDGMEAVLLYDEVKPDLILMDIKMPNLDGLEATKIIRELSATIPIIAQSAFAYEHDVKAAMEAGCNDFIAKPIAQSKLKEVIDKWLPMK
jgi:CheY-like chemotaxis protein